MYKLTIKLEMSCSSCKIKPLTLHENCYCNHDKLNFVIRGGYNGNNVINEVTELKGPDFKNSIKLSLMISQ